MHLRALLRDKREAILDNFVERVRLGPLDAGKLSDTLIRDGLPSFLDRLAADLDRWTVPELPPGRRDPATAAAEHGEQRHALGVDVVQVAREWAVLQDVIIEMLMQQNLELALSEYQLFTRHINGATIEAIRMHTEASQRQVPALS